jgi:plasmid stabilization system protein ParE
MVRTIRWTETAIRDLNESARFIARDSPYYAAAFVKEVRRAARSLNISSERGRIVPESERPDIREIYVKSYRLIYQVKTHEVFLLSFIHGSRDLESLWKKRFEDYQF